MYEFLDDFEASDFEIPYQNDILYQKDIDLDNNIGNETDAENFVNKNHLDENNVNENNCDDVNNGAGNVVCVTNDEHNANIPNNILCSEWRRKKWDKRDMCPFCYDHITHF